MLHWKLKHRRHLLQHVQDEEPLQALLGVWWIIAIALSPVFDSISITLSTIQVQNLVILQQCQKATNLISSLYIDFNVRTMADSSMVGVNLATILSTNNWWLEKMSVVLHIQDQRSWAHNLFKSLPDDDKIRIVKEIGIFVLWIMSDGLKMQAERDHNNVARTIEAPPVMPAELVMMRTGAFISNVFDPFHQHLEKFWSVEKFEKIECDHKDLLLAYALEPLVKEIYDAHDYRTFFNDTWDNVKTRFLTLRHFYGRLVSASPTLR